MKRYVRYVLICFSTFILAMTMIPSANAYDLPSVNLGFTSFMDMKNAPFFYSVYNLAGSFKFNPII